LADFTKQNQVDAIFIALPMASQPRILKLLDDLKDSTSTIYFAPDIFVADLIQARVDEIAGIPVVAVCETPFYGLNGLFKRLSDIVISIVILLLIAPLLLVIAVSVKFSSPGPVIFKQRRYGLDGHKIVIYKFRTMTVCEDGDSIPQAQKHDQRVTPLGAFLRRTSMDELPQFINILRGEMSLVGPRPPLGYEFEEYDVWHRRRVLEVKPGLTGLWQVSGRSRVRFDDMVRLDLQYAREWSFWLDVRILLQTPRAVLLGDGAY